MIRRFRFHPNVIAKCLGFNSMKDYGCFQCERLVKPRENFSYIQHWVEPEIMDSLCLNFLRSNDARDE